LKREYNFSSLQKNAPWKLLLLAAACDVGAFSLYNYVISAYEVSTITIITASQAAVIALLSWKFLKERLTLQQIVGLGVVLLGLISLQLR
jgi:drug/metabolite transporter (DMT)-like permease